MFHVHVVHTVNSPIFRSRLPTETFLLCFLLQHYYCPSLLLVSIAVEQLVGVATIFRLFFSNPLLVKLVNTTIHQHHVELC